MDDGPIGARILYAISCGLSDHDLPELEREDIYQALGFAGAFMEEKVVPLEHC